MGLMNFIFSTIGKCIDFVSFFLDLHFVIVHTLVRSVLSLVTLVTSLPALIVCSSVELWNIILLCLMSAAETTSDVAHGIVTQLGNLVLSLGGVLESLKMVGYLSMHVLLCGREHLYRGLLSVFELCSITVSLLVYFTNTVLNFVLIATQNLYSMLVSVWQTVSSPLQKIVELTLTLVTFLYSSLVGTSNFLWIPCKLVLDFLVSLTHIFISIFILNLYGLLLTVTIVLATTIYLNPELMRRGTRRTLNYIGSVTSLHRLSVALQHVTLWLQSIHHYVPGVMQHLQKMLHCLYVLKRGLWHRLSRHSSLFIQTVRTNWDHSDRVGGDGDPGEERRDPPDGRAGDIATELIDLDVPSSSTMRPLKKLSSSNKDSKPPAERLLSLLKEQEERKRCVICQDNVKTVVLLPCRHLCLCRDCTNILLHQPIYQQNCPLCRHMILDTMDVYL